MLIFRAVLYVYLQALQQLAVGDGDAAPSLGGVALALAMLHGAALEGAHARGASVSALLPGVVRSVQWHLLQPEAWHSVCCAVHTLLIACCSKR